MKGRTGAAAIPRLLRPLLAAGAIVVACSLTGCSGGNGERERPTGPLAAALSYLSGDFPAVVVVGTDSRNGPVRRLDELASRFSAWKKLKRRLEASLHREGLDFRGEVRPQLGNPFALGISSSGERVGAIRVRAPGALRVLAQRRIESGRAERLDDYKGALVWKERSRPRGALAYSALADSDLVVAQSEDVLRRAIDTSAGEDSLAFERAFTKELAALGPQSLIRAVGDARRVVEGSDPEQAASARRVPWVRALGLFELAARIGERAVRVELALRTNRASLTSRDLPIARGSAAPLVHDLRAPTALAVRDPEQLFRFFERLLAVTDPKRSARLRTGLAQMREFLGVDIRRDLLAKIENLSIAVVSATGVTFEGRLGHATGSRFTRALDRAAPFVEGLAGELAPGTVVEARGGGARRVWLVRNRGLTLARYAVRRNTLVGSVGLATLPEPVRGRRLPGARGALSLRGDPRRITVLGNLLPGIPREAVSLLSRMGDLTLGVRAETGGLTGRGSVRVAGRRP